MYSETAVILRIITRTKRVMALRALEHPKLQRELLCHFLFYFFLSLYHVLLCHLYVLLESKLKYYTGAMIIFYHL